MDFLFLLFFGLNFRSNFTYRFDFQLFSFQNFKSDTILSDKACRIKYWTSHSTPNLTDTGCQLFSFQNFKSDTILSDKACRIKYWTSHSTPNLTDTGSTGASFVQQYSSFLCHIWSSAVLLAWYDPFLLFSTWTLSYRMISVIYLSIFELSSFYHCYNLTPV
jgi:hypothetical protein